MTASACETLTEDPDWVRVLSAYASAERQQPPAPSAGDEDDEAGWVPRLREIDGVVAERLAPLHGKLIAHGLLKFVLLDRTMGVAYHLTPEGRQLLSRVDSTDTAGWDSAEVSEPAA